MQLTKHYESMEEPKTVSSVSLEELYQSTTEDTSLYAKATYPVSGQDYQNTPFHKACWFLTLKLAEILCEKESKAKSHLTQLVWKYVVAHHNGKKYQGQVKHMKVLLEKIGLQAMVTGKKCDALLLDIPRKCLEGTLTRLENLLNHLNADPTHALYLAKKKVVQAFAAQFVEKNVPCSDGLRIHRVNDMVRSVEKRYKVNPSFGDDYMRSINDSYYRIDARDFKILLNSKEGQIADGTIESLTEWLMQELPRDFIGLLGQDASISPGVACVNLIKKGPDKDSFQRIVTEFNLCVKRIFEITEEVEPWFHMLAGTSSFFDVEVIHWRDDGYGADVPEDIMVSGYRRSVIKALVVKILHDKGYLIGGVKEIGSGYQIIMTADSMVALLPSGEYTEVVNYLDLFNFISSPSACQCITSLKVIQQSLLDQFNQMYLSKRGKREYNTIDELCKALFETRGERDCRGFFDKTGFRRWQVIRSIVGKSFDFDRQVTNHDDAKACLLKAFVTNRNETELCRSVFENKVSRFSEKPQSDQSNEKSDFNDALGSLKNELGLGLHSVLGDIEEKNWLAVNYFLEIRRLNRDDEMSLKNGLANAIGQNPSDSIFMCAKQGLTSILKFCADNKFDLNEVDQDKKTLLHVASEHGQDAVVSYLIESGADVNAQDQKGRTPLWTAANFEKQTVVDLLVSHPKIQINLADEYQESPLLVVAKKTWNTLIDKIRLQNLMKSLLRNGNDLLQVNRYGESVLLLAANNNLKDVVRLSGQEAIKYAAFQAISKEWNAACACLLNVLEDINTTNSQGETLCYSAAIYKNEYLVDLLLKRDRFKSLLVTLQLASSRQNDDILEIMIRLALPHFKSRKDMFTNLLKLHIDRSGCSKFARYLIRYGADVNDIDGQGCTLLIRVAKRGNLELAALLILYETNINKQSFNKNKDDSGSALIWAAYHNKLSMVTLFLNAGANVNLREVTGKTALYWAAHKGFEHMVSLLLEQEGIDVNSATNNGSTALIAACSGARPNCIKINELLIQLGADVNAVRIDGASPLILAAKVCDLPVVQLLLSSGAEINHARKDGCTALTDAVLCEKRAIAQFLHERGALISLAAAGMRSQEDFKKFQEFENDLTERGEAHQSGSIMEFVRSPLVGAFLLFLLLMMSLLMNKKDRAVEPFPQVYSFK